MEDDRPARRDRLSDRRRGGRRDPPGHHPCRPDPAVAVGAGHALHGLGLSARRTAAGDGVMSVKLRYFAWVRERVGKPEEEIDIPAGVTTIGQLMGWLSQRGDPYGHA